MTVPLSIPGRDLEGRYQETANDILLSDSPQQLSMFQDFDARWKEQTEMQSAQNSCTPDKHSEARPQEGWAQNARAEMSDELPFRRAIPFLPRPQTFRRQESERRERLLEVTPTPEERRAASSDRKGGAREVGADRSFLPLPPPPPQPFLASDRETSCPTVDAELVSHDLSGSSADGHIPSNSITAGSGEDHVNESEEQQSEIPEDLAQLSDEHGDEIDRAALQAECEQRWIHNLTMHYRDQSNREKFFVTFAEIPTKWRRLTISLDYRNAPLNSLEEELSTLPLHRDKSFRIYQAIRLALPDVQYYDTVTNLKLETTPADDQLHVHVHEDENEIIHFPNLSLFGHVQVRQVPESQVEFVAHLSGFVYKVRVNGTTYIKKEIPGPSAIDEFLYEVNALDALLESDHIIQLEGLVTNESGDCVKGLLIAYASRGPLIDMLYEYREPPELEWPRREKWAKQIVGGLKDIHEAGYVQGDFTISNIVIDGDDNAKIIDINRRGCPVGWEPPELARLIDHGQRISMCISVKTDLFQLGMVLWGLAAENDEPERFGRPLDLNLPGIPGYFLRMIKSCLSDRPQDRASAKSLSRFFPRDTRSLPGRVARLDLATSPSPAMPSPSLPTTHRMEYIDPRFTVTIDDVHQQCRQQHRGRRRMPRAPEDGEEEDEGQQSRRFSRPSLPFLPEQVTYVSGRENIPAFGAPLTTEAPGPEPQSAENPARLPSPSPYNFSSSGSYMVARSPRHPATMAEEDQGLSHFSESAPLTRRPSSPYIVPSSLTSHTSLSRESSLSGLREVSGRGDESGRRHERGRRVRWYAAGSGSSACESGDEEGQVQERQLREEREEGLKGEPSMHSPHSADLRHGPRNEELFAEIGGVAAADSGPGLWHMDSGFDEPLCTELGEPFLHGSANAQIPFRNAADGDGNEATMG